MRTLVGPEFSSQLIMSKDSFRKVITCRHEPACFFRDLPMGNLASGHFGRTCYHPLFMFNQFGDLKRSLPRPGNVHGADGWRDVLEPVVERYRERDLRCYFRGDAASARHAVRTFLGVCLRQASSPTHIGRAAIHGFSMPSMGAAMASFISRITISFCLPSGKRSISMAATAKSQGQSAKAGDMAKPMAANKRPLATPANFGCLFMTLLPYSLFAYSKW